MPQRLAQGKQQPQFDRNPCIMFRDNCDTDGRTDVGWTTDGPTEGRRTNFDFMSSQAELEGLLLYTKPHPHPNG